MTKDVLLSISGMHYDVDGIEKGTEEAPIELITPASYYLKNGKHYVKYEEPVEGIPGVIKNTVKVSEDKVEMIKSGLSNTHMIFEKGKIHMTDYETPYGNLLVGVHTRVLDVQEEEKTIGVRVNYELDVNGDKLADCNIRMEIRARG
ncbi:DUF1934 domain-containing protein [Clostridiaceae bacterium 68-1-5]|uniref:DUF1934 domain-containing protein n=1 Tax=Suipraeoptans intestinalis TaxID=2606628 RepID=A0A6N7V1Z3_9FIRM|nr:DUF1934 domain-containing protein [Suipraeoptans intestinalis]MSR94187.1 DUF1934 domain-containing protein [Suipraeoptans intestinalis]